MTPAKKVSLLIKEIENLDSKDKYFNKKLKLLTDLILKPNKKPKISDLELLTWVTKIKILKAKKCKNIFNNQNQKTPQKGVFL